MKDQYVGDVNDYLKYALLRSLRSNGELVTIVWMLTPEDSRADGRRLGYLNQPTSFRSIDPPLFDILLDLVQGGVRSVEAIKAGGILPNAKFFDHVLTDNLRERSSYMTRALAPAGDSQLMFFDPDNGLDVPSVPKGRRNSSKYVYRDEVASAYERGASVVIYQHFPRRQRLPFLRGLADELLVHTNCRVVQALSTPHVAYLVLPRLDEERILRSCMENLAHRARSLGVSFLQLS